MKIRSKLIVAFLLVAIFPIALLAVLNQRNLRSILTDSANQALMGAASQAAASIDDFISSGLDSVRVESRLPELADFLTLPEARRGPESTSYRKTLASLNALSRKNQLYVSSYALLDLSGNNIIDTYAPRKGDDESRADYFIQATRDSIPHVSPVLVAERTPMDAGLYFSCAVQSHERQPVGVLRVRYRAAVLQEPLVQTTRHLGDGYIAMLVDEHNICLAHSSQPEWISTPAASLSARTESLLKLRRRLPEQPKSTPPSSAVGLDEGLLGASEQPFFSFTLKTAVEQVKYTAAIAQVTTQPWLTVFAKPRSAFLAPINRQIRQTLLLALLICSGVVAVALLIAHLLANPIVHLRSVAGAVARGDLEVSAEVSSHDEIGELGTTFNHMTDKLRELVKGMQDGEEALRDSEQRFRKFFELGLVGMAITSADEKWVNVNDRLCEILGYPRAQLTELTWAEVTHPEDRDRCMARLGELIADEVGSFSMPQRFVTKSGETVFSTVSMTCVRSDDTVEYILALVEDITERRRAEKEKQRLEERLVRSRKMEALGLLAGGVAHDLNNVLSGIVSYPDLILLELPQDSKLRRAVLTMQDSGKRAAAIVQDLLTLSRRGVTSTDLLNLNDDIVRDYLASPELAQLKVHHPGVELEAELASGLLSIRGSSVHLKKTVMNLVTNAAEAQPGGGRVIISTCNRYVDQPLKGYDDVEEGEYVVLRVEDQGVGISEQDLQRIFEPFYTKKVMGRSGTGLGMAVVWGTVHDHNGYIDIQSTEGEGTIFELYFPAVREVSVRTDVPVPLESYTGGGEKIMVVDDIEEQREIAERILKKLGYRVITTASGEEAVAHLQESKVDLLVLDMIMDPGIDGLETYRRVIAIHPGQRAIIASGFAEDDRVKEAQRLGAGSYVQKPYSLEQLGIAVKTELDRS
jgi:PAS domain S-box-containing protein